MSQPHYHATKSKLLRLLSHQHFISGDCLGGELGISRMAVSKHIAHLNQLGLDIFSVKGKGYRLAKALSLLDVSRVRYYAPEIPASALSIEPIVSSTNDLVRERMSQLDSGDCVAAECQLAGRGRQGRNWISPFGASIYVSSYWRFAAGYQSISGLSLAVGLAVVRTLNAFDIVNVGVKWPNDIFVAGGKISGVLIELEGQFDSDCHCILGVGINVDVPSNTTGITQAWTDMTSVIGRPVERSEVLAVYLNELHQILMVFQQTGLQTLQQEWNRYNLYQDKFTELVAGNRRVRGLCQGIDEHGALLLIVDGEQQRFHGGELRISHD